jgi:hypothetical protein
MSDKNKVRMILLIMALYNFASGFLIMVLFTGRDGPSPLLFIHWIIMAILIYVWVKLHAKAHGVLEKAYACFAAIFPPVGVSLYLFRAFGRKGGLTGTLKALGFFLILLVLSVLGSLAGGRISS